jgi:hypothetical protein
LIGNSFENGPIDRAEISSRLLGRAGRNSGSYNHDIGFDIAKVRNNLDPDSLIIKCVH